MLLLKVWGLFFNTIIVSSLANRLGKPLSKVFFLAIFMLEAFVYLQLKERNYYQIYSVNRFSDTA